MPEVHVKLGFQGGVKRGQMDGEERKSVPVRENGLGGLGGRREKGRVNKLLLHTCRMLGISHSLISRSQGSSISKGEGAAANFCSPENE